MFLNVTQNLMLHTHTHTHTLSLIVPTAPQNVTVTPINSTSLRVTWQPPATPNGQPIYIIYYTHVPTNMNMSVELPFETRSADIVNLAPYTDYSITVAAKTSCAKTLTTICENKVPPV